jgi:hypothetical protein
MNNEAEEYMDENDTGGTKCSTFPDRSYDGGWVDDMRSGKGTMTYPNGDVYDGNWKANQMNGQGKLTYKNGDVYEGNWVDGKENGTGTMTSATGEVVYNG